MHKLVFRQLLYANKVVKGQRRQQPEDLDLFWGPQDKNYI